MTRVALVPGVLALLPEYAGLEDPVAELRAAAVAAVRWLGEEGPVAVVADPQGERVARALLVSGGFEARTRGALAPQPPEGPVLVVGNGSARRSEKAPGHLDPRAADFDRRLAAGLRSGDLSGIDRDLAAELWADVDSLCRLAGEVRLDPATCRTDYEDDPFGVQYWVMRWEGEWR